ncbi:MAG: LOG family protein [Candidatus Margulisiibacteriota bacterium]
MHLPDKKELENDIDALLSRYAVGSIHQQTILKEFILSTLLFNWEDPDPEEIVPLKEGLDEIRNAITMFKHYKYDSKITIFGSARTAKSDDLYQLTYHFAKLAVQEGFKTITGAGPGIMEAGNAGAGPENSFGLGLQLPFESLSKVFSDHPQHVTVFKHFYSRKLTFYRESQAIVVMPGGYGTMDEIFQGLASIQTGKLNVRPFILLDKPNGTFWKGFDEWIRAHLLEDCYIHSDDFGFYTLLDSAEETLRYIQRFYHHFFSYFILDNRIYFQLKIKLSPPQLSELNLIASGHGFGEIIFIRERYYNNQTLFVYSCLKLDKMNFAIILKLIHHINQF